MPKIYELTPSYRIGRRYVNPTFRSFYSKFIVLDRENIPSRGPVIFAPNHQNALMDALVVLASTPYRLSNTFIARSDIFKKGFFAKALRFLKILPAFRIRDGYENLGKNDATFEAAREVLEQHNALCVMPEGNQGDQRKLRPFAKGIFRIAFTAQEQMAAGDDIRLIPVGIDYSNRERFGEEVIVDYGKPLRVSDYMPLYRENPAVAINRLRADLKAALHRQVVDLSTEQHYEAFETVLYASDRRLARMQYGHDDPASRFRVRREVAGRLVAMEADAPERAELLAGQCAEYKRLREGHKLMESTLERPGNAFTLLLQGLGLAVLSPVFACGFVLNLFPFFLPGFIRKKMGVKYNGFFSSFDYVLGAVFLFPFFYLLQTILYAVFTPLPWWTLFIFAPAQYLLGKWAFRWYKAAGRWNNRLRYAWLRMTRREEMARLTKLRRDIQAAAE